MNGFTFDFRWLLQFYIFLIIVKKGVYFNWHKQILPAFYQTIFRSRDDSGLEAYRFIMCFVTLSKLLK